MANGNRGAILDAFKTGSVGYVTGFVADGVVEATRMPYFDEVERVPGSDTTLSNFEKWAYLAAGGLAVLGLVDLVTAKRTLGIGEWALPFGVGLGVGVQNWESFGASAVGVRS